MTKGRELIDAAFLAELEAGLAEGGAVRREGPPDEASVVLRDIYSHLRYYLRHEKGLTNDELAVLLAERDRDPAAEHASEGIQLAVGLLYSIHSALRLGGDRFIELIFGKKGLEAARLAEELAHKGEEAQKSRAAGGRASGKARSRKRDEDLDKAACALIRLQDNNDVKKYTLEDIAQEAQMSKARVRVLRKKAVTARAEQLRQKGTGS